MLLESRLLTLLSSILLSSIESLLLTGRSTLPVDIGDEHIDVGLPQFSIINGKSPTILNGTVTCLELSFASTAMPRTLSNLSLDLCVAVVEAIALSCLYKKVFTN